MGKIANSQEVSQKSGHRKRTYKKLLNNGYEALLDYEVVELMLFLIFKRKDIKPLAKTLVEKFGTIDKILSASKDDLVSIDGVGEKTFIGIKIMETLVISTLKSRVINKCAIECFDDVIKYCKIHMKNLLLEEFRVIFLNGANEVIGDKIIHKGSIDTVNVCPREIVRKCIENGAKGLILVHNHPSGDPTPSTNDVFTTKKIKAAVDIFNITIYDHIIIGGNRYVSFKTLKLL
ncbi:MAG: DNA repair protein RadC [Holosporales bacterium]|jgi:DNA repair protein RadC|nr:DNA repair protein RadC [Holosporales bacterium]